ncbi:GNAT family N-acetyltransferase [Thalassospira sp.]|uniref:GNAT family N-acetyltransferase n=1 Tax=Thalassospira sp. TaxID=1912094 RepID=UPI00273751BF|nr:GNAT family N-acetyltransferase [Thalassospira sp.]MDP2700106.1 GNAT family N-acetyltransferase [Thalassospira sp.]
MKITAQPVLKTVTNIHDIGAAAWDRCAGDCNPFVSFAFLSALEDSGSVAAENGWHPMHLVAEEEDGKIAGIVPIYVKSHSYGEYVFDWNWAEAFERAGGQYYPKLQVAVPFSPVPGPRLLVQADHPDAPSLHALLMRGLMALPEKLGVSSLHITFCSEDERTALEDQGFLGRIGLQYHWQNQGYQSFDDFLGALNSRKRKNLRKERRQVIEAGYSFAPLSGDDLHPRHWDRFYHFYRDTSDRKWGTPYLTRAFFELLHERLRDKVILVSAHKDGEMVAGALNLIGADTLYGRNWGTIDRTPLLHFETCYYQAIDIAIARNLKTVEAGAQGEHKIQRGYEPVLTHSAHLIRDPGLRNAVARFLDQERASIYASSDYLKTEHSPYRQTGQQGDDRT